MYLRRCLVSMRVENEVLDEGHEGRTSEDTTGILSEPATAQTLCERKKGTRDKSLSRLSAAIGF